MPTLQLGDIAIEVIHKPIRNVHLAVHPPEGRVTLAAPLDTNPEAIRLFAIAKLPWLREQRTKLQAQQRESPREYIERESHYVWGTRYLLRIVEKDAPPAVELRPRRLLLQVRPGTPEPRRREILEAWYRTSLREAVAPLLNKWEPLIGVKVDRVFVQKMKTKWGSCSRSFAGIRLNTDLARKPPECLEYVLVHELAHLLEPTHNKRFTRLLDRYLPNWQQTREALNRLPVRDWPTP